MNDQLSAVQAANVDATFQVSDQVLEYAEFFRGEYITLLEDVIKDLGSKIELQIGVQTKILQHMQKMEELHRKKVEKMGEE